MPQTEKQFVNQLKEVSAHAFAEVYAEIEPELTSYLFRLVANRDQAEDLAQDTFLKGFERIETYAGASSVKTWLFAIATNLARDYLRRQQRWHVDAQDRCREKTFASEEIQQCMGRINQTSTQGQYEVKEHIDMCFTCLGKTLPIEQQMALILKDIYGFTVREIARILDRGEGAIKHAVRDARQSMIGIFDRKCSLVSKQGTCYQCSELNGLFNPKQAALQRQLALAEAEPDATRERLYALRMDLVRAIDPLTAQGADLHHYMLELIEAST
ncbi:MAG: RNA polymerase sigma factor [Rhodothermaceae bacterium]|nr:RNA polymerase sigma factor [Rhodothermaceae bacterium]